MRVLRDTPFEFGFVTWQFKPGETSLVLVIKATFDLSKGDYSVVAAAQAPVSGEAHYDDDLAQSLRLDTDLALYKPRGECWFVGSCYAPGGAAATHATCALRVGAVKKSLVVIGDRAWGMGAWAPSDPAPFLSMPLRWEHAFGGPGFDANPVGRGVGAVETPEGASRPLPNLEDPGALVSSPSDRPAPAGFFPIPRGWRARTTRTGTYDRAWLTERWPHLPADFDFDYYNATPRDQQIDGFWSGDEEISLLNLHPSRATVSCRLPGLVPRAFLVAEGPGDDGFGEMREVPLRLDTIILDGDALQAQCVFRGHAAVVDEALSGVSHLFYVHHAREESLTPAQYREWFLRRLREEADEDAEEADEEAPSELAILEPMRAALAKADLTPEQVVEMMTLPPTPLKIAEARANIAAGRAAMERAGEPVPPELEEFDRELATLARQGDVDGAALRRRVEAQLEAGDRAFVEAELAGADLSELDLRGCDFTDAVLRGANLSRARLDGATLDGATLDESAVEGCTFAGASMRATSMVNARGAGCVFDDAKAPELDAEGASLPGSSWLRAAIDRAELVRCDLTRARFIEASVEEADLSESRLDDADLSRCIGVSAVFDRVRAHRVRLDDARLERVSITERADLTGASAVRLVAPGARWNDARLHKADLSLSVLTRADFTDALLVECNLSGCDLRAATFRRARLTSAVALRADAFEACFEEADLSFADLRAASLFAAEFWRATLEHTRLDTADLRRSKLQGTVR